MAGVKAKKKYGQHFLVDKGIAARIVEGLTMEGYDSVIEVGPGTGILTELLLRKEIGDFRAVEVDSEAVSYLKNKFKSLNLVSGDFLRYDMGSMPEGKIGLIGNFPYNISSQILFRVIDNRDRIIEVTGMFQKEVAERICSGPGSKSYGILSVLLGLFYNTGMLFTVPPGAFRPPPKVTSAVIRLRRNNVVSTGYDLNLFRRVVKATFNQRRKMIRNSLGSVIDLTGQKHEFLSKRPEQLSVSDFETLTRWVEEITSDQKL